MLRLVLRVAALSLPDLALLFCPWHLRAISPLFRWLSAAVLPCLALPFAAPLPRALSSKPLLTFCSSAGKMADDMPAPGQGKHAPNSPLESSAKRSKSASKATLKTKSKPKPKPHVKAASVSVCSAAIFLSLWSRLPQALSPPPPRQVQPLRLRMRASPTFFVNCKRPRRPRAAAPLVSSFRAPSPCT